jgi:hypothetical protein
MNPIKRTALYFLFWMLLVTFIGMVVCLFFPLGG